MDTKHKIKFEENKMWLIILKHVIIALALVIIVAFVDMEIVPVNKYIPKVLLTNFELSTWILTNIATALLTITTFTFSIAMVVLTTYASNYSPRVVEDFFSDKANVKVLGVFIGGFVYSIISLLLLNNVGDYDKVISAGVAIAYSLVCVVYFVIFIFSVANSIHAQKFITKLYNQACEVIDIKLNHKADIQMIDHYTTEKFNSVFEIKSPGDGFVEYFDTEILKKLMWGEDYLLTIDVPIGQYVFENQNILTLHYNAGSTMEERKDHIAEAIGLSGNRHAVNDYKFAIQKITEIGMRAFSPAINDPNTGINCINSLASLSAKLSKIKGKYSSITVNYENGKSGSIVSKEFDFESDLTLMFYQLANYSKEDASLIFSMLHALNRTLPAALRENKKYIKEMAEYAYSISINNFTHPMDIKRLDAQIQLIRNS